jgi:hypothetical protein
MRKRPFEVTIGNGIRVAVLALDNFLEITSKDLSQPQINFMLFSGPDEEHLRVEYSMALKGVFILKGEPAAAAVLIPCSYVEALLVAEGLAVKLDNADRAVPKE